ncbi:MAG: DUF86 domain-containing protein [Candidatus Magasanikbacteria bacterium]
MSNFNEEKVIDYLRDILDSIKIIEEHVEGIDKSEFFESITIQDVVVRRFTIIGEVVKRVPDEVRNEYDNIPWRRIAGMRDIVVHDYDNIDLDSTWKTTQKQLPKFKAEVENILEDLE